MSNSCSPNPRWPRWTHWRLAWSDGECQCAGEEAAPYGVPHCTIAGSAGVGLGSVLQCSGIFFPLEILAHAIEFLGTQEQAQPQSAQCEADKDALIEAAIAYTTAIREARAAEGGDA